MDEETRNYRGGELARIDADPNGIVRLKFEGDGDYTKWLNITEEEFRQIAGILKGDAVAVRRFYGSAD